MFTLFNQKHCFYDWYNFCKKTKKLKIYGVWDNRACIVAPASDTNIYFGTVKVYVKQKGIRTFYIKYNIACFQYLPELLKLCTAQFFLTEYIYLSNNLVLNVFSIRKF